MESIISICLAVFAQKGSPERVWIRYWSLFSAYFCSYCISKRFCSVYKSKSSVNGNEYLSFCLKELCIVQLFYVIHLVCYFPDCFISFIVSFSPLFSISFLYFQLFIFILIVFYLFCVYFCLIVYFPNWLFCFIYLIYIFCLFLCLLFPISIFHFLFIFSFISCMFFALFFALQIILFHLFHLYFL